MNITNHTKNLGILFLSVTVCLQWELNELMILLAFAVEHFGHTKQLFSTPLHAIVNTHREPVDFGIPRRFNAAI